MRKAERRERERWEALRLAQADGLDQALGKSGQQAQRQAHAELPASQAKSRSSPGAQRLLIPVTPPQPEDERVMLLGCLDLCLLSAADKIYH